MPGKLTTHVLDTARGKPAAGVAIELHAVGPDGAMRFLARAHTNADGRTDAPILEGGNFCPGTYVLTFDAGGYFGEGFFDLVPIRFRITDPTAHYHVPLLCSPWAYSTYRGS